MNIKELRVGNFVCNLFSEKKYSKIDGFDSEYIYLDEITIDYIEHKDVEPILLTNFWLLKLGFIRDKKESNTFHKNDFKICLPNYFIWNDSYIDNIKFVHQLQNVYFALYSKDLTNDNN